MSDFQVFKLRIRDVELLEALRKGKGITTLRNEDGLIVTLDISGVHEDGIIDN